MFVRPAQADPNAADPIHWAATVNKAAVTATEDGSFHFTAEEGSSDPVTVLVYQNRENLDEGSADVFEVEQLPWGDHLEIVEVTPKRTFLFGGCRIVGKKHSGFFDEDTNVANTIHVFLGKAEQAERDKRTDELLERFGLQFRSDSTSAATQKRRRGIFGK